jgi:eukaryotic translation initiation factor 2C
VFGVRVGKDAVFPAEFCTIVPGQVYKKKLNGRDTTTLLGKSTMRPDRRLQDIQQALSRDVSGFAGL